MKTEKEVRDELRQILLNKKRRAANASTGAERSERIKTLLWVLTGEEVQETDRDSVCELLGWDDQCCETSK